MVTSMMFTAAVSGLVIHTLGRIHILDPILFHILALTLDQGRIRILTRLLLHNRIHRHDPETLLQHLVRCQRRCHPMEAGTIAKQV